MSAELDLANGCRRYAGKTCVVTASTQGIGFAIAARLAAEGGNVVVSSRKQSAVDKAVQSIGALVGVVPEHVMGIVCHVNNEADRRRLLEQTKARFGSIDVLVLNAAASTWAGKTLATPPAAFDKMIETNLRSTFLFAQQAVPYMTRGDTPTKPGAFAPSILLVGSVGGYNPAPPIGIYSVTKTAMIGLMKAMAADLAPLGIRVNLLAPGLIRTQFSSLLVDAVESNPEDGNGKEIMSICLLKRVGEAREMAGVAAFLCSADASYVVGESLVAAGGSPKL